MHVSNLVLDLMHERRFFTVVDAQHVLRQAYAALHEPMISKIVH